MVIEGEKSSRGEVADKVMISRSHPQRPSQIGEHPLAGEEDLAAC